ncbi:MAG: ABC transporter permease, partial [Bryobacteraceae bacterium]
MHTLRQDLAFAFRMLAKTPGFTIVAIATLALGIGANSAIYSVVNAVLFKSLPYPDAGRLVFINEELPKAKGLAVSWPDYVDWRAQNQVFEKMAAYTNSGVTFINPGEPKLLPAAWVASPFFSLLGAKTALGHTFGEADDKPGAKRVAVLSYRMWRNELKADPDAIGKEISLDGALYSIIGVLVPDFDPQGITSAADVYLPIGHLSNQLHFVMRANHPGLMVIAKIRAGVPLERTRAELKAIMDRLAKAYPESNKDETAVVTPIAERLLGDARQGLPMLLAAVGAVLLIACANVAHLSLARATSREREFAIRAAVGASRSRLIRQLFAESALLSSLGGAAGLLLAYWSLKPLIAMYPNSVPGLKEARLDPAVLLSTLGLCVITAALFGLAPMLRAARAGVNAGLREGAGFDSGRQARRLRSVLFVAEIAIAVVLTAGAGLLLRSLAAVLEVNPGFRTDHLLTLDMVRSGRSTPSFFTRVIERIAALPGVESASAASGAPLFGSPWSSPYAPEGQTISNESPWTLINAMMPGYLQAIQAK